MRIILISGCLVSVILLGLGLALIVSYVVNRGAQITVREAKKASKTWLSPLPPSVQQGLKQARRYGQLMLAMEQEGTPRQRKRLTHTMKAVNEVLANLTRLEQNLEKLYGKRNLRQELAQTTVEIDELQSQLPTAEGRSAQILDNLLKNKEKHRAILNSLQAFQQQIELTIRQNASVLNSTHAEMILLTAKDNLDNNRVRRLNQALQENSDSLVDLLEAMEEMEQERYGSSGV